MSWPSSARTDPARRPWSRSSSACSARPRARSGCSGRPRPSSPTGARSATSRRRRPTSTRSSRPRSRRSSAWPFMAGPRQGAHRAGRAGPGSSGPSRTSAWASSAGTPIGRLSGGQQQRAFIARALVTSPRILFLDEPTTGVDAGTQDSFYDMLDRLNRSEGLTIVLVTHDIGIVNKHVTSVACLNQRLVLPRQPRRVLPVGRRSGTWSAAATTSSRTSTERPMQAPVRLRIPPAGRPVRRPDRRRLRRARASSSSCARTP
ncbi:MAG: ATP-binding cassette domain-containing protein [Candidatus Moduliflexus flocculans]|nr:ATP-binding cassette domain-containing protein [Candidatus Moduliflexus flocculans]